jgi:TolB-like protein
MKKIIIPVLLCLIAGIASAKDNLAVLPFTGGSGDEGETVAELFSFSPDLTAVFNPIPRTSISRAIRNERNFQSGTGMTDPDTIAALGRQLGAKYVVAGSIAKLGQQNLLIISILKIDDLRQIAGDIQTYVKIEELQGKLPSMARNIIEAAKIDASKFTKLAVVPVELRDNIDPRVADTLAQILSINLIRSGKYAVYPRTASLEQVQTEYHHQLSGETADEHRVDIGKGENPRLVLSVIARKLGAANMFNASIINLESGVQEVGKSVNYQSLDDGIEIMGSLAGELTGVSLTSLVPGISSASSKARDTGSVSKVSGSSTSPALKNTGAGMLNILLGLGSFTQGDWGGGLTLVAGYGVAGGLIAWEMALKYEDDLAGIPGPIGIGVAALTVAYGFVRPWIYNKNPKAAAITDRVRVTLVPQEKTGSAAVSLSYTIEF